MRYQGFRQLSWWRDVGLNGWCWWKGNRGCVCLSVSWFFRELANPRRQAALETWESQQELCSWRAVFFFPGVAVLTAALIPFCALVRPIYELKVWKKKKNTALCCQDRAASLRWNTMPLGFPSRLDLAKARHQGNVKALKLPTKQKKEDVWANVRSVEKPSSVQTEGKKKKEREKEPHCTFNLSLYSSLIPFKLTKALESADS